MNERTKRRNRIVRSMSIGVVIAILVLAVITVFLRGITLPLVGGLVAVGLFFTLVIRWHARTTRYTCPTCRHSFQISPWTDFLSPQFPNKKLLVCPRCDATDWCPSD